MKPTNIDLKRMDRDRLEALRAEVERELDNRRFEERLLWELRQQARGGAAAK